MSSEEYVHRLKTPFSPPTHTLAELRAAVPKHLYVKSTTKSLSYVFMDIALTTFLFLGATNVDSDSIAFNIITGNHGVLSSRHYIASTGVLLMKTSFRWLLWGSYWTLQGLVWAGMWSLGHEAGHGTLSPYNLVNDTIGYILHTALLVPYFSWKITHHAHHRATGSVERDENYVPTTRSSLKRFSNRISASRDILDETPVYTLLRMLAMQFLGWHAYLWVNALGSPMYPPGTNHFSPSSELFKPKQRIYVYLSNLGLTITLAILCVFLYTKGLQAFVKHWLVPYMASNFFRPLQPAAHSYKLRTIVMVTFLQHTDPTVPHYRVGEWSFVRGALTTVDRPLLGSVGRFFLHNASHDHIAHHYFPMIPFYNQPQVTEAIKPVLGHSYNYDSTNSFYALYRSFTQCEFIEDGDAIAFYVNKSGSKRPLADGSVTSCERQKGE
ncbi:hypothetical protein K439DRAFT_1368282 [Ramaria rubella]|nr:hypothetical protein K439DRAFT_1368282 [Ramaria rubella]